MKRFLAALLAALTVFTLTGCGKTENPAEPVTPGQAEEPATPTEPELTPEEIAEQERLAAEKAREERLQGLLDSTRWTPCVWHNLAVSILVRHLHEKNIP